jgi:hypothetical protein
LERHPHAVNKKVPRSDDDAPIELHDQKLAGRPGAGAWWQEAPDKGAPCFFLIRLNINNLLRALLCMAQPG